MQAMLLAAGLGTRLRPLTDLRPKPIVPVANRPLAAFAMDHLAQVGVRSIVANTHPQAELVESALAEARPEGVKLRFSRESTLLGTGGGLRRAFALFDDRQSAVIVMNGDTVFAPDLRSALKRHRQSGAVATMILRKTDHPERFGAIGIDEAGWVRSLLGAPASTSIHSELMFTGVHILAPEAFEAMPGSGCVIRSAYRSWIDAAAPVLGIVDDSPWADLGTISDYHRLNLELASGSFRWPGIHPTGGSIVASPVRSGQTVRNSVVGADVELGEGVSLERCVVWAGSVVTRSATNAVITPKHRIEIS